MLDYKVLELYAKLVFDLHNTNSSKKVGSILYSSEYDTCSYQKNNCYQCNDCNKLNYRPETIIFFIIYFMHNKISRFLKIYCI